MNNEDLNQLLKSVPAPEQPAAYWEQFPQRVCARLERHAHAALTSADTPVQEQSLPGSCSGWFCQFSFKPALAAGLIIVCLGLLLLPVWRQHRLPVARDSQFAEAQNYFQQIHDLFPNQLQAIVFDQRGARLLLADSADVPASAPLYIKISGPDGCQRFVTFSGQQIPVNGEACEVLVDHAGNVILVGRHLVWSSADPASRLVRCQIQARPLGTMS